ncbi:hypothetical protein BDY21DRAFT_358204 [Lineolata rhizophorae]|uniref:Uncharacterized protein n=1 Tax=Lineolata rhizophorae TaxID=578093 RepID=A0A6A6NLX4_9PEZI|nr:hypothetical protein BDY21DRAFT_358204 [Lineolata rhizophorae]
MYERPPPTPPFETNRKEIGYQLAFTAEKMLRTDPKRIHATRRPWQQSPFASSHLPANYFTQP